MNDRIGYEFYRDVFGGWRWEHHGRDGTVRDSRESFDTWQECIEDARNTGLARVSVTEVVHPELYDRVA